MGKLKPILLYAYMCKKFIHIEPCMSDVYEIFTLYPYNYAFF